MKKKYQADTATLEKKLARIMERLGVTNYQYDWTQSRGGSSCFVEMLYNGAAYRFENSTEKSKKSGRCLVYVSDLFAAVVYSLEGLARAVEQDIFTLDMLLTGVPSLPAPEPLEECFKALGFDARPMTVTEVKQQYWKLSKECHPDTGGSNERFEQLNRSYRECLEVMREVDS